MVHVLPKKTDWDSNEVLTYLHWSPELREQHGNPLFKISCFSFFPPSPLASPIKALMLFALSFLWPPSSTSVLRLSSPSVSNSSSFIETNRLEVTPGRAADDSWLLRSTQSEGFSFASKTRWYSFVAMAPNFLLAWSTKLGKSLQGLLNGDVQLEFGMLYDAVPLLVASRCYVILLYYLFYIKCTYFIL